MPAFHQAVFARAGVSRVIANIGGMANISLLPGDGSAVCGFDTGPGNTLMDAWACQHLGLPFDTDGLWAASGQSNEVLLSALMRHPFLALPPPKSTGREDFNIEWLGRTIEALATSIDPRDTQATLLAFTVGTLSQGILDAMPQCSEVFLCGGGARNLALVDGLRTALGGRKVDTTESLGIHPDWVEACAFAWLACQTLSGLPGNLPSVTGAHRHVVLGGVYPGKLGFGAAEATVNR